MISLPSGPALIPSLLLSNASSLAIVAAGSLQPANLSLTGPALTAGVAATTQAIANAPATGAITLLIGGQASGLTVAASGTTRAITGTPSAAGALTIAETGQALGIVGAAGSGFTMTQLAAANRVYQRATTSGGGQNKGQGVVPVTINVTTPGTLYARVRSSDGITVLQAPFQITGPSAAGAQTVNVSGVDARLGWFYVDLSGDGTTWINGTVLVGMGRIIGASGQSLAVRMFGRMDSQSATLASLGITPSPYSAVYATYTDSQRTVSTPAWAVPADGTNYDASFVAEFLRLQVAAAGVNCAMVAHSRGAQPISAFVPGGSENAQLRANLDAVGGFESFLWMQGHNDAGTGMSAPTYQSNLGTLFTDLTSRNAVRGSSYERLLCTIPNISSTQYGTFAQKNAIRQGAAAWAAANSGKYVDFRDIALIDGIHQSMAGGVTMARHFYRATRSYLGLPRDDTGPAITAANRAAGSASIALSISLPSGATALATVGTPGSRFAVFAAGDLASPLALDATTPFSLTGTTVTLNLASAPADSQALDVYFGYNPDPVADGSASMIYDNSAGDGDGLSAGRQLQANFGGAVAVAAPSAGGTKRGPDLTTSGTPAYQAGKSGFGQERAASTTFYGIGTATDGTDVIPAPRVWAIEGVFSILAAPTAIKAMFGVGLRCWIGVNAQGRLVGEADTSGNVTTYVGDSTSSVAGTNPIVTDGARHHVALCNDGGTVRLFLDGALVASSTTAGTKAAGGNSPFNLGNFAGNSAYIWPGTLDEFASWNIAKYTAAFTPPTTSYTGNESGLVALYHLDGNLNAATY